MFPEFLERHPNLTVVNSLPFCEGLITRKRIREWKVEESILDFFVVCDKVLPFVTKIIIDEEKNFVLKNYKAVRNGKVSVDSDHNTMIMEVSLRSKK